MQKASIREWLLSTEAYLTFSITENDIDIILDNVNVESIGSKEIDKEEIMEYVDDINKNTKDYLMEGFNYVN